jgi:hypothetical protein
MYGTFPPKPDGTGYGVGEGDGAAVNAPTGTFAPDEVVIVTFAVSYNPCGTPAKIKRPMLVLTFVDPASGDASDKNGGGAGGGIPHGLAEGVGVAAPPQEASSDITNAASAIALIAMEMPA